MKIRRVNSHVLFGLSLVAALVVCASVSWAHWGGGYQYTEYAVAHNPDWMGQRVYTIGGQEYTLHLSDDLHISELSIPGTHDTFSKVKHSWTAHTQMMNLPQQLESGIRMIDVRCNVYDNGLQTGHGKYPDPLDLGNKKSWPWFGTVLKMCVDFLSAHPTETILMRLQRNTGHPGTLESFVDRFNTYIHESYTDGSEYWEDWFWHPGESEFPTNPTLGEVRGKIVLLQSFSADSTYGLDYTAAECCDCTSGKTNCESDATIKIQDSYSMSTVASLKNWKAAAVVNHLKRAAEGDPETIYVNYLVGSGGVFPYFVASGHTSPETGAPHLWTGECKSNCGYMIRNRIGCCYYNGTNEVATSYLIANRNRAGIVAADFPGPGLIKVLIEINYETYSNWPPTANSGSAYEAAEGTSIIFDASDSSDPDGDPLQYRWDFDDDGTWDTEWSDDPTASHAWYDNACQHDPASYPPNHPDTVGVASVQVRDAEFTSGDAAFVIIHNVDPTVTIDEGSLNPCILPRQPVSLNAIISDPGCLDTHTATWTFGDGAVSPGIVTKETECPDTTGVVSVVHSFKDFGLQYVHVAVQDDDRGSDMDTTFVQVMTALEAVDCAIDFVQNLPASCFKKPAGQRRKTLMNKLAVVRNSIAADSLHAAVQKLEHDIRAKADGSVDGQPNNDWIVCEEAQRKLCMTCDGLIGYLAPDTCVATVTIESFKAELVEAGIELSWDVSSNGPMAGFKIERRLAANRLDNRIDAVKMVSSEERRYVDGDIRPGQSYRYTLTVVGGDDSEVASQSTSVKTLALDMALYQNQPNPFNPTTTISFALPNRTYARLSIYNIAGNCIRTLVNDVTDAGVRAVGWDGKNDRGNAVSSGIYFYRLTVGNRSLTKKMVLLK